MKYVSRSALEIIETELQVLLNTRDGLKKTIATKEQELEALEETIASFEEAKEKLKE